MTLFDRKVLVIKVLAFGVDSPWNERTARIMSKYQKGGKNTYFKV